MKNVIKINSIILLIVLIINLIFPIISMAAEDEVVTITFKDENLYNSLVEIVKPTDENEKVDKESKTIYISKNKLGKITSLDLADKGIKYIDGIEKIISLSRLDLSSNEIEDITPLKNLTDLCDLRIGKNKITQIDALKNLSKLDGLLDLGFNNINDISSLSGLNNLQGLAINDNNISDATILDNELKEIKLYTSNFVKSDDDQVSNIKLMPQTIAVETNASAVELPKIFLQAQDTTSRLYTDKDYKLTNCELSKDKKSVTIKDLTKPASIEINGGIADSTILNITYVDETAPKLESSYSTTVSTNQSVTVTIKANEDIQRKVVKIDGEKELNAEGWNILDDNRTITKEYKVNASEKICVYDLFGNRSEPIEIKVQNIDTINPQVNVEYSTTKSTNETVTATIKANEEVKEVEGWSLSEDRKTLTKVYTQNETENVDIYDLAGNKITANIQIKNIDKENPQADIEYSTTKSTNQNVTVTIKSNKQIQEVDGWELNKDGTTLTKEYEKNAEETVTIYDLAGNKKEIPITINNIDKESPKVTNVDYSSKELTNQNVTVEIHVNEEVQEIEGWTISTDRKSLEKVYEKNTEENVIISDLAGNWITGKISITNIDKDAPKLQISYSETEMTEEPVTVEIEADEEIQEIEGWELDSTGTKLTKVFDSNESEEVIIYDLAGNSTEEIIQVENIGIEEEFDIDELYDDDYDYDDGMDEIEVIEPSPLRIGDSTLIDTILPSTGRKITAIVLIIVMVIISIVVRKKYDYFKQIK